MANNVRSPIGKLPKGWHIQKLKDITTKIGSGSTPRGGESAYIDERVNFAFIRSQNVFDYEFDPHEVRYVTDEDAQKLKNVHLQKDDILLNITGDGVTFGRACIVPEFILPAAVNQHVSIIRLDQTKCLPGYFLAFLCLPQIKEYIGSFNAGGSRRAITKGHIESFEIPLAPLHIQILIQENAFSFLSKIQLNRQTNQTLEAMAQALFKSWFVDFDPVIDNALAAGHEIPEPLLARAEQRKSFLAFRHSREGGNPNDTVDPHVRGDDDMALLPESIRQLFPNRFVLDAEMGWIPEGWEVKSLDQIAHYQNGLALQKFRPEDDSDYLPVVKIAQLKKGYADGEEKASSTINPSCILDSGDVVFSWSGSLMVDLWCGGKAALNQHLFKVTSETYPKWFYLWYTKYHLESFQRIAADKAVTMGHIKRSHLSAAKCVVPASNIMNSADNPLPRLLDKEIGIRLQTKELTKLRDTLLPKLISGELRLPVPEAEDIHEQLHSAVV